MVSPSDLVELERTIPSLRRYAVAMTGDRTKGDDLVQECLERALVRLDRRRGCAMRPWLFTLLHGLSTRRWQWRRNDTSGAAVAELPTPPAAQTSVELRAALRGLDALPPDQRRILLLVAVEGFGYAEVAAMLALPVGTVMTRLSRARDTLRATMASRRPLLRRVK